MKKIKRTRIRTETKRLVFIQEQTGLTNEALDAHEFCPACGQPLPAPVKDIPALPIACAELHDETKCDGVLEIIKQEEQK